MSPTPAGVIVTATRPDGTTQDVTAGVQTLYDLVIQSMDWGSGFLTVEDTEPVVAIAEFCGFKDFEEAQRYIEAERTAQRQRDCEHSALEAAPADERGAVYDVCADCGWSRFVRYERPTA